MASKRLPHNLIIGSIFSLWILIGCTPDLGKAELVEPIPPKASFSGSKVLLEKGQQVNFTDGSTNVETHLWTFEGGEPATSTIKNPEVTYNTAGSFSVSLKVRNSAGEDEENKANYITVIEAGAPPTADFSASLLEIRKGQSIDFSDESTNMPTTWAWNFEGGDPATSTEQYPTVIYPDEGTFNVSITVTNAVGEDTESKTEYITVTDEAMPPIAAFTPSASTIEVGQTITYTDESTNVPTSWAWVFDGGDPATSTAQNPIITYPTAGIYSVSLTATNADGEDVETKTDLITVTEPVQIPVADFTASATTITSGQDINFTDTSTNTPTSWAWTFVGGTPDTSTEQNPTIRYNNFGIYEVSLTATNAAGNDVETKTGFITVNQQTASYTVTFQGNWNVANHPTDFPSDEDHFSSAVGMVHQQGVTFFEEGVLATLGIKDMAELGDNGAISNEISAIVSAGDALSYVNGGSLSNGSEQITFTINVTEEFSFVTVVSMIAPSPDWFVTVENVALFNNGSFVNAVNLDGISYDAGTDSGTTFTSGDAVTSPAEPIAIIKDAPLGNGTTVTPPVAFFSFVKN